MEDNFVYNLKKLKYSEILKQNAILSKKAFNKEYEIKILSNITVNPIREILEAYLRSLQMNPHINFGNYDNVIQDSFKIGKPNAVIIFYDLLNIINHADINIELLEKEEVQEIIDKCKKEISLIFNNLSGIPVVIFNKFYPYKFDEFHQGNSNYYRIAIELNQFLIEQKAPNVELIDTQKIISALGAEKVFNRTKFLKYKLLYSFDYFKLYVSSLDNILLKNTGKLKKVIVFDCDNTLWKGIIGEDGLEGIDMSPQSSEGIYFHLIQKMAVNWSKKGILICLCSKNNLEDVLQVLDQHEDAVLHKDKIVALRVNWSNKDQNIRQLAKELNVGLDSFVFIDDSEFETNLVKTNIPEVLTICVPKKIQTYPILIGEIVNRFFNVNPLKEDMKKLEQYKQQVKRTAALVEVGDIDTYLASLGSKIIISKDEESQISRIAQLTQKTNQFNLTTKRYTENDILNFVKNKNFDVFTIDVSDKYGNSGITGVAIIEKDQNNKVIFDSLLMSCRILGRKIENVFINYLLVHYKERNISCVKANYIKTKKNNQVKNLYEKIGFNIVDRNETYQSYLLVLDKYEVKTEKTIKIITK